VAAHRSSEFREIPTRLCLHTHLLRISPSETIYAIETRSVCRKQPAAAAEVHTPCIPREATMAHNIRTGYDLVAYILSEVDAALRLGASLCLPSSPLKHTSRSWRFRNAHLHHLSLHNFRSVGIYAAGKSVYPFSVRSPVR
jgi:hypothetical protein